MGLIFCSILLAFLIFANIFIKKMYYDFAIFFLALGVAWLYFDAGYKGFVYVEVVMLILAGYHLVMVTKMRR